MADGIIQGHVHVAIVGCRVIGAYCDSGQFLICSGYYTDVIAVAVNPGVLEIWRSKAFDIVSEEEDCRH